MGSCGQIDTPLLCPSTSSLSWQAFSQSCLLKQPGPGTGGLVKAGGKHFLALSPGRLHDGEGGRDGKMFCPVRERTIGRDFHNAILRCTNCQLKRRESYKRKEGKRPFSRGTGRRERCSTEISWPKNAHPQSHELAMNKDWSQGNRIF